MKNKKVVFLSLLFSVLLGFISCSNGLSPAKKDSSDLAKLHISTESFGRFATASEEDIEMEYSNLHYYLYGTMISDEDGVRIYGEPVVFYDGLATTQGMYLNELKYYDKLYVKKGTWEFTLIAKEAANVSLSYDDIMDGYSLLDLVQTDVVLYSQTTKKIANKEETLSFKMTVNPETFETGDLFYEVELNSEQNTSFDMSNISNIKLCKNNEEIIVDDYSPSFVKVSEDSNIYALEIRGLPIGLYSLVVTMKTNCFGPVLVENEDNPGEFYVNHDYFSEETVIIDDFVEIKPLITSYVQGGIDKVPLNMRVPLEYNEIKFVNDENPPTIQTITTKLCTPLSSPRFRTSYHKNEKLVLEVPGYNPNHYEFAGWYYLEADTSDVVLENYKPVEMVDGQYVINADYSGTITTVAAKYVPIEYTLNFDSDVSADGISNITYTINDVGLYGIELPQPTKKYYDFLGWYDNEGDEYTVVYSETIGNQTFYAKWEHHILELEIYNDEDTTDSILTEDNFEPNNVVNVYGNYGDEFLLKAIYDESTYYGELDIKCYVSGIMGEEVTPEEEFPPYGEDVNLFSADKLKYNYSIKLRFVDNNDIYESNEYTINFYLKEYSIIMNAGENASFNKEYLETQYSTEFENSKMELSEDKKQLTVKNVTSGKGFAFKDPEKVFDYPYYGFSGWDLTETTVATVYDEDLNLNAEFEQLVVPEYFVVSAGSHTKYTKDLDLNITVDYGDKLSFAIDEYTCNEQGVYPLDYEGVEIYYTYDALTWDEDDLTLDRDYIHYVPIEEGGTIYKYDEEEQITLTEDCYISFFGRKEGYCDSTFHTVHIEINPASVKDVSVKYDEVVNEDMYMTIKAVYNEDEGTLTYDLTAVFDDAEKYADEELDYLWSINNTYLTLDNEYVKSLDKNTISLVFTEENISTLGEKDTPCVTCTVRRKLSNNRYTVIGDVTFVCEDL